MGLIDTAYLHYLLIFLINTPFFFKRFFCPSVNYLLWTRMKRHLITGWPEFGSKVYVLYEKGEQTVMTQFTDLFSAIKKTIQATRIIPNF
jgi:hypothetical protein